MTTSLTSNKKTKYCEACCLPKEECDCVQENLQDVLSGKEKDFLYKGDNEFEIKNNIFFDGDFPVAVRIKYKNKYILVLNADDDAGSLVGECTGYNFPTVSYTCLSRLFHKSKPESYKNILAVANMIKSVKLKLMDYTPEYRKNLTKKQRQQLDSWLSNSNRDKSNYPIKMEPGCSIVSGQIHRSSTCLFKYVNRSSFSLLLGVDENQYFGCRLVNNPTTVKHAFTSLIPKNIRKKTYFRQGEWFIVQISEKTFPSVEEFDLTFNECSLPIDDKSSNQHMVYCSGGGIKNNIIYALNPNIEHSQHDILSLRGHYYFVKNTATQSVSQEGVD